MSDELPEASVIERLTKFAPLSDFCLVGALIYVLGPQANWSVLRIGDDKLYSSALRLLPKLGVRQFDRSEDWITWCRNEIPIAGGFLYEGQRYRFQNSFCAWKVATGLDITAIGSECKLDFEHIPIDGVHQIGDLEGSSWPPLPSEGFRRPAPVQFPCTVCVENTSINIASIEIDCGAYNADPPSLNIFFQSHVRGSSSDEAQWLNGSLYCRIVPLEALSEIRAQ